MKQKSKKSALLLSFTSLLICFAMLVGSTFAWFTDTATTGVNKIVAGNLDVELWQNKGTKENPEWSKLEDNSDPLNWVTKDDRAQDQIFWEPGCTYELPQLKIVNNGNLALKYKIQINGIQGDAELNQVIDWTMTMDDETTALGTEHHLAAKVGETVDADILTIKGHMQETASNHYQNMTIENISITVVATQDTVENDSYGNTYDVNAEYPAAVTTEPGKNRGETIYRDATKTTYTYSISSAEALKTFAQMVTDTPAPFPNEIAYNAILTKDIDMTNVDWGQVSIAAKNYVYVTIDGNGHTIKNLNVTDENTAALFTSVGCESAGSAKVMNLTVADSHFKAAGDGDDVKAGVFQAKTGGHCDFVNCHAVNCTVESNKYGGGFIGYDACGNSYTLKNCSVKETTVISTAAAGKSTSMGGFIGYTQTPMTFDHCVVSNNTVSTGKHYGNYVGTVNAVDTNTNWTFTGCKVGDSALTKDATNFGRITEGTTVTVE